MNSDRGLQRQIERQAARMRKAEHERRGIIGQTAYLGTLGLLLILPVVGGAYLGTWLDSRAAGYSTQWTVSLILLGIGIGVINIYLFTRD